MLHLHAGGRTAVNELYNSDQHMISDCIRQCSGSSLPRLPACNIPPFPELHHRASVRTVEFASAGKSGRDDVRQQCKSSVFIDNR